MVLSINSQKNVDDKLKGKIIKERVKISGSNLLIEDVDFCSNDKDHMVNVKSGKKITFLKCKFHGKSTEGVVLNITGNETKGVIVEDCEFFDLTSKVENGGETIRLGLSDQANKEFNCIVRGCKFDKIRTKEPELISIKSVGNLVEKNMFNDNTCSVVIRHGFNNTIQDNTFEGEGGIRVHGKGNKVLRNHHRNNRSEDYPPLSLVNGNVEDENLQAQYAQVRDLLVEGNTYEDCKFAVLWGRNRDKEKKRKFKPKGVKFIKNKIIAANRPCTVIQFHGATPKNETLADNIILGTKARIEDRIRNAFKKGDVNQPDPVIVPPIEEEEEEGEGEEEQPPVVIPPQPETEPGTQPTPEDEPYVRICQLCGREEARKKLVIYVCTPHAEVARPDMQKLLTDLKAKVDKETIIEEEVITTG
jgi:parallel beta-helix repeat protein